MTTSADSDALQSTTSRARSDVRGLWRTILAVIAPLPLVAKGIEYVVSPVDGDATFRQTVAAYAADPSRVELLTALDVVFGALLIPAVAALVWVARRGAPRWATTGALLSLPAFSIAFFVLGGPQPARLTAQHGLDIDATAALTTAVIEDDPLFTVVSVLFLVGIVVGLPVVGVALWRSRAVPIGFAACLVVGAATHPFISGHVAQGIGLLVAALGFVGGSRALFRMGNDDFDLPALRRGAPAGRAQQE